MIKLNKGNRSDGILYYFEIETLHLGIMLDHNNSYKIVKFLSFRNQQLSFRFVCFHLSGLINIHSICISNHMAVKVIC